MVDETPVLEMRGITKRFPGIVANDAIDFDLRPGEVHALLGENGAGKSTLMNILYGLYTPDEGEILIRGEKVVMHSPRDAIAQGIGMVHQHFMLIPVMTVAENVVLADEPTSSGGVLLDYGEAEKRVRELADRFKFAIDPHAEIQNISVAQQQRVEILKALYRKADILILDEPTAVLTPQEADELFEILRGLIAEGLSVIFITHKLDEVLHISDRITTLRRGKLVETIPQEGATEASLAKMMVGREVLLRVDKKPAQPGDAMLRAVNVSVLDDRGLPAVRDVSFEVRAGEIVGIAGVDGNGQTELIDALTGLRTIESGQVFVGEDDCTGRSAREYLDEGMGHIPEDRQRRGLVLEFTPRREPRPLRVSPAARVPLRNVEPAQDDRPCPGVAEGLRRARRWAPDARLGALGRQPAEGRPRAGGRARPARPARGAADAGTRRRGDRVRAPSPDRGTRRGSGDPAGVLRARGDPLPLRSHPRRVRGPDRRRVPADCDPGGARLRDGRRNPRGSRLSTTPEPGVPPEDGPSGFGPSTTARMAIYQRAGGVVTPVITTILAFLIGGIVVAATGHNPFSTYKGIFEGTGLNWFFPWVSGAERVAAEFNLQQTLLVTTPLILTGLAVAFAFRCGMFNIGGLGQYIVGAITSVWVGSVWAGLPGVPHAIIAIVLAMLAGAVWAGIAGILKATVGAHEVITTIMLNWIAYWVGTYAFGLDGPLQNEANKSVPISNDVVESVKLHVWWGDAALQGLHIGFFIALAALVVYWFVLNRTTLGYEVRAVGYNPEAARYGGINVARNYFLAMAIAGSFAGLGGAIDILGWQYRLGSLDIQNLTLPFVGIAVALLGRNTAIGVLFSSLLFGALLYGTSTRSLDPDVFPPQLAGNLTLMIQALVLLFVGADVLVIYVWNLRRKVRRRKIAAETTA